MIVNFERMKVKRMDIEKGIYTWIPSNLLLVTFKGSSVPENVHIYNGLAKVPVRPYVDSVIQWFGFGFNAMDSNIGKINTKGRECV